MTEIVHKFDRELDMTPEEEALFDQYILEQEIRELNELCMLMQQEEAEWERNDSYFPAKTSLEDVAAAEKEYQRTGIRH